MICKIYSDFGEVIIFFEAPTKIDLLHEIQSVARIYCRPGMSNSNHCAGRTLSFKARKAYSGPQFGKTCYSVSILDIF